MQKKMKKFINKIFLMEFSSKLKVFLTGKVVVVKKDNKILILIMKIKKEKNKILYSQ